jgi:hypothetical protein
LFDKVQHHAYIHALPALVWNSARGTHYRRRWSPSFLLLELLQLRLQGKGRALSPKVRLISVRTLLSQSL